MRAPVVADRYYVSWAELGRPTVPGDYEAPGLGIVVLDDADTHYVTTTSTREPAFFVRLSKALGGRFVVVSREQPA